MVPTLNQADGLLADVQTVIDIFGTIVTATAVIVGGWWAYFKFVKARTFRPRVDVGLFGQWRVLDGRPLLHARITVKNIGASDLQLVQEGTGLRVSRLKETQASVPVAMEWERFKTFRVLGEHHWIEPGETVSDDLLLDLGVPGPLLTLFEARLLWSRPEPEPNIDVLTRRIIPADAVLTDDTVKGQLDLSAEQQREDPAKTSGAERESSKSAEPVEETLQRHEDLKTTDDWEKDR